MVRAVLFDFYGTLARAVAWGATIEEVLAGRGLVLDRAAAADAGLADGVEHREHSGGRERYVAWERARLARLVERCRAPAGDVGAIADEIYAATKAYTLAAYEEVPGVLESLGDAGITVGVCSNWDWDLDRALAQAGLADLVDVVVTSARVGVRKPHPGIFRHALERCGGVPARSALFVGDTWGPDVEGPLAAGLRPVFLVRDGHPHDARPPGAAVAGVPTIHDLRGLLDLHPGLAGLPPATRRART